MKVKLLKGFNNGGQWLSQGDEFEGTPAEIDDLVRQGYAEKPKDEAKPSPPPPTKVKLVKGFTYLGRQLNPGDEFEGAPDQIDDLIRQGYAEQPEEMKGAHPPQQDAADDPPDDPPAPQHRESQHGQHEHSASARTGPTKKHTK